MGARYAPETFGLVLSHSPSMWWTPERTSRPGLFSETDTSWVSEHLLSAPPQGVRISLCVDRWKVRQCLTFSSFTSG